MTVNLNSLLYQLKQNSGLAQKQLSRLEFSEELLIKERPRGLRKIFCVFKGVHHWEKDQSKKLVKAVQLCHILFKELDPQTPVYSELLQLLPSTIKILQQNCSELKRCSKLKSLALTLVEECVSIRMELLKIYPQESFKGLPDNYLLYAQSFGFQGQNFQPHMESERLLEYASRFPVKTPWEEIANIVSKVIILGFPHSELGKTTFSSLLHHCFQAIYQERISTETAKEFLQQLFFSNHAYLHVEKGYLIKKWYEQLKQGIVALSALTLIERKEAILNETRSLQHLFDLFADKLEVPLSVLMQDLKKELLILIFFDLPFDKNGLRDWEVVFSLFNEWICLEDLISTENFHRFSNSMFKKDLVLRLLLTFFEERKERVFIHNAWKMIMTQFCQSSELFIEKLYQYACSFGDEELKGLFLLLIDNEEIDQAPSYFTSRFFDRLDASQQRAFLGRLDGLTIEGQNRFAKSVFKYLKQFRAIQMIKLGFISPIHLLYKYALASQCFSLSVTCEALFKEIFPIYFNTSLLDNYPLLFSDEELERVLQSFDKRLKNVLSRKTLDLRYLPNVTSKGVETLLAVFPCINLKHAFNRTEVSNAKVICHQNHEALYLHSTLLTRISPFFKNCLENAFLEGTILKEATMLKKHVELVVDESIFYFLKQYPWIYETRSFDKDVSINELFKLLVNADYFLIEGIKNEIENIFSALFPMLSKEEIFSILQDAFAEEEKKELSQEIVRPWIEKLWPYSFHALLLTKFGLES